jgi:hypothetical protein
MRHTRGSRISRRGFLANGMGWAAVGALGPMIVPRHVLGQGLQPPSETLRLAAVGIGGIGQQYLEGCDSQRIFSR